MIDSLDKSFEGELMLYIWSYLLKTSTFFCSNNLHSFNIMFSFHLIVIFMLEGIPRIARVERYVEYVMATNGYIAPEYVMIGNLCFSNMFKL